MKGEEVDFDLLKIKSKLHKTDKPLEVRTREDFVHLSRRRRGKSKITELINKKLEKERLKEKEKRKEKEDPVALEINEERVERQVEKRKRQIQRKKKTSKKKTDQTNEE